MQQHCLECRQTAPNQNNFCQRAACPAEVSPWVFEPGEWIEHLEIVRVVLIGRTATIYEAHRNQTLVTLKVAHPGELFTQRLKAEAQFLRGQRKDRLIYLPLLLDPYGKQKQTLPAEDDWAYGRVAVHGTLLYFLVFAHIEGEPLRDLISKRPQLWSYHAGWIAQSMAIALHELHQSRHLHLALSPESALVTFDRDDVPRVVLIDCGTLAVQGTPVASEMLRFADMPYVAPQLRPNLVPDHNADSYSLAVLFAQMLLGQLPRTGPVQVPSMSKISALLTRAMTQKTVGVATFNAELQQIFGAVPLPRTNRWPTGETTLIITIVLLGLAFSVLVGLTLYNAFML